MTPCGNSFVLDEVEAPDLVQAPDVIGMGMRDQNPVQTWNPVTERLLPEIRGDIDQKALPSDPHPDRGPGPGIPGIA
jgi:hypothetical protein